MKNLFILPLLLFLGCNENKTQLEALQISDSLQLEYLAKQGRYIEALANETEFLKWQIDSLKTANKALKEMSIGLYRHSIQVDSILDKEITNISLAKKAGKRLKQIAAGFIGL